MKIENLDCAMNEMFDFITDMPSGLDGFESDFDAAFSELEKVKSDNVVPVVLCNDCVFATDNYAYTEGRGENILFCETFEAATRPNDFCCCGEMRKDNVADE